MRLAGCRRRVWALEGWVLELPPSRLSYSEKQGGETSRTIRTLGSETSPRFFSDRVGVPLSDASVRGVRADYGSDIARVPRYIMVQMRLDNSKMLSQEWYIKLIRQRATDGCRPQLAAGPLFSGGDDGAAFARA